MDLSGARQPALRIFALLYVWEAYQQRLNRFRSESIRYKRVLLRAPDLDDLPTLALQNLVHRPIELLAVRRGHAKTKGIIVARYDLAS
jgi:hypothetical protein